MGTQFKHIDLVLSGASQNLGASLTDADLALLLVGGTAALVQARAKKPGITVRELSELYQCKGFSLQAHPSNANPIYVGGGDQTVSTTSFGWFIPTPSGGVPSPPLFYPGYNGSVFRLGDLAVIGTAAQILHIMLHDW